MDKSDQTGGMSWGGIWKYIFYCGFTFDIIGLTFDKIEFKFDILEKDIVCGEIRPNGWDELGMDTGNTFYIVDLHLL